MEKKRHRAPVTKQASALPKKPALGIVQLSDTQKDQFFTALLKKDTKTITFYLQKYPELANVRISYFKPSLYKSNLPLLLYVLYLGYYKEKEGIKIFLDAGSNVNEQDVDGNNALSYAMLISAPLSHLHYALFNLFIERDADLNAQNTNGETPLIIAAQLGLANVVERMISHSLNKINTSEAERKSSYLGLLPADLRQNILPYFLNPNIKDKQGKTALNYAILGLENAITENQQLAVQNYAKIIEVLEPIIAK